MSTTSSVEPPDGLTPVRPWHLAVGDDTWELTPGTALTVGRGTDAQIRVEHPEVSRRHAVVEEDGHGGWTFRDLGSANGSFAAGERVSVTPLRPGVQIRLGTSSNAPTLGCVGDDGDPTSTSTVVASSGTVTIGRAQDNDLVIDDLLASRHHARATRRGDGFWIEDLGSLNGTYVNGHPVTAAFVGAGDLVTIGHVEFRSVGGELTMTPPAREISFAAHDLRVVLPDGKQLLGGVDIDLPACSLLAVIGPSGAGKSTLLGALTGYRRATSGSVTFDGRDLYANFDELRHRVGLVPQDDVVHPQLTVSQALEYASLLRFPADLDPAARRERIRQVITELGLTAHVDTRIDRLSGGQRKRTSVALELLTEPSLLFLDEPTSGLDPGLDKSVMQTLRGLADDGRTVIVVTHSVANLGLCDRVLLLAPGGTVAFFGPPGEVLPYFSRDDYSDVFTDVAADPEAATAAFRRHRTAAAPAVASTPAAHTPLPPRRRQSLTRQVSTLSRRHVRVLLADRSYALFMALLPVVLGLLVAAVPGEAGFGPLTDPLSTEPRQLLVVLIVGAAFMGLASSARDLVAERAIFRREKGVGLSPTAYLTAKLLVFAVIALIQSALFVGLVSMLTPRPDTAAALGNGTLELYLATAATTFASATTGLLISAWVSTSEQVMPLMVIGIMAQLVLCGGLIQVADQAVLEQLAVLTPSRWGYAAGASSVDIVGRVKAADGDDLWSHDAFAWWRAMGMLGAIGLTAIVLTGLALRRVGRER